MVFAKRTPEPADEDGPETHPLPTRPQLRAVEPNWIQYEGEPRLLLRDPLALSERVALIPRALVPLVAALDGTRDRQALLRHYALETGAQLAPDTLDAVLHALDQSLLLESPRLSAAKLRALTTYRSQPFRPPALAARSYPATLAELGALLDGYGARRDGTDGTTPAESSAIAPLTPSLTLPPVAPMGPIDRAAGVLSPHIDYTRGGPVYAATWSAARPAVATAEVVVIFGTDHHGSAGRLTPTRQRYATPWGAFPSGDEVVNDVARALGEETAYDEELHHRREHSIELVAVWLHWALRRAGVTQLPMVVPILCGSFHCYTRAADGSAPLLPEDDTETFAALDALAGAVRGRRTLVVSAADLAHVGPAFGDPNPLTTPAKNALAASDAQLLAKASTGDATVFLAQLRAEEDRRRVCGLPPTYWTLRLLERLTGRHLIGRLAGYDVCPADARAGSVVSIAGLVWE